MGRLNPEAAAADEAPNVVHFSHPHQLQLTNPQTPPHNFSCSACNLNVDAAMGPIYTCKPCNFTLHLNCYKLPQQMNHPFHQHHELTLQPRPVYPQGLFCCDACGNHGGGFSYHCGPCRVDLHTTCATLPTQFVHACHHHQLGLHYAAPYPGNAFSCNVCNRRGSNTWIYRCCEGCDFDAHLTCVAKLIPGPARVEQPQSNARAPPSQSNGGGLANQVMVGAVVGLASSVVQLIRVALMHGIIGGGGSRFDGDYDDSYFDGDYDGTDGGYDDGDDTY